MRIVVYSDAHGNLAALRTVLSNIENTPDVDLVAFLGDASLFGPRPDECASLIREHSDIALVGNTDQWVFDPPPAPDGASNLQRLQYIRQIAAWTQKRLSDENKNWLARLPFSFRVSPSADVWQDLLLVHANPQDTMQLIYPSEKVQQEQMGQLQQSDDALGALLGDTKAGVIAFGHLHFPNQRQHEGQLLANVSSVSLPLDGDPRAKYGILDWDGARWNVQHVRLKYDIPDEIAAWRRHQPPDWETSVQLLQETV